MNEYRLDFGTFIDHENGILESLVDEGVEVGPQEVNAMLALARGLRRPADALLANRHNSYSFSLDAVLRIAQIRELKAVAVLHPPGRKGEGSGAGWPQAIGLAFFTDRQQAWDWLSKQLAC